VQHRKNALRKTKCACVILYKDSGALKTISQTRNKLFKLKPNGSLQGATHFF